MDNYLFVQGQGAERVFDLTTPLVPPKEALATDKPWLKLLVLFSRAGNGAKWWMSPKIRRGT
jgi:hypothetical protein